MSAFVAAVCSTAVNLWNDLHEYDKSCDVFQAADAVVSGLESVT